MPSLVNDALQLVAPVGPAANVDLPPLRLKGKWSLDNGPGTENTILVDFDGPDGQGTSIWSLFAGMTRQQILDAISVGVLNAEPLARTFAGDTLAGY